MSKDCISIIIPTYNAIKTIRAAINSIKSQNVQCEIEIIVVDDCSTDGTEHLARELGAQVFTHNNRSGGPNRGRNIGMKEATGQYVCFLDQDDIWLPGKLAYQLNAYNNSATATAFAVCSTSYRSVNTNTWDMSITGKTDGTIDKDIENSVFINRIMRKHDFFPSVISSLMIPMKLIKHSPTNFAFEEHFGMCDFDWILRVYKNRPSIHINMALVERRIHGGNLSLDRSYRITDYCNSIYTFERYMSSYPRETRIGRRRVAGTLARYFYLVGDMPEARRYFLISEYNFKTLIYFLTTFAGSLFIKHNFNIFGTTVQG